MSLVCVRACACVCALERETRENVPHFVIPVVTKTGDFLSVLQKKKRRRMMTTMAICPSSSSMTTTTFSALHCWRRSGGTRRRCLLVARGRGERERDAFGERDVLKRLGKLKRAVAQNRTKDTVPTAETIGMRFSEVLQSCSISIYVVVSFDRVAKSSSRENSFYLFPIRFSLGGEASFCSLGVVSLTARCFSLLYYVQ